MRSQLLNQAFLLVAAAVGILLYFAAEPLVGRRIARVLIGWDAYVVVFLSLVFMFVRVTGNEETRQRIVRERGSRHLLLFAILMSIASVVGLVKEAADTKAHSGSVFGVLLAIVTIVLSWLFVQIVYALRYAHEYYVAEENGHANPGLDFGAEGEPDFWDFVHFSLVVGATAQTADITFTSRKMRRMSTSHTLLAFGFNTAILATMINIAAGLF